jgi:hypothetical protein
MGEGEGLGFRAHIEYKVEKYDKHGNLTETIVREDEATPEVAQDFKALLDSLPDKAAEKE